MGFVRTESAAAMPDGQAVCATSCRAISGAPNTDNAKMAPVSVPRAGTVATARYVS